MFKFEKPEITPTVLSKLPIPLPVHDRARAVADEHGVEVDAVLVQALENAFGLRKRSRKAKALPQG